MLMTTYYFKLLAGLILSIINCNADLCNDNSDICELITGCYADRDAKSGHCNMPWWAYVPKGSLACPKEGCPLYIWMDGTPDSNDHQSWDDVMQFEMIKRGFVAVNVGYDNSLFEYVNSPGCESSYFFQGIKDKAKAIFDSTDDNSVVSQMCEGSDALAKCDLGIATHGFSQGAQLASLAHNYDKRVTANLLFGNGINNPHVRGDFACVKSQNLALPRERRRSLTGANDDIFGNGNVNEVLMQQKVTSGYDCGDKLNCSEGGGSGYYIVSVEEYIEAAKEVSTNPEALLPESHAYLAIGGVGHMFFRPYIRFYNTEDGFPSSQYTEPWGISYNLDWLARTARNTMQVESLDTRMTDAPTYFPTYSPTDSASEGGSSDML